MTLSNYACLFVVVLGLSAGQVLFKLAGRSMVGADSFIQGLLSPYFFASLLLYGIITIVWIWQLSMIDLSRAYPVIALTFVIVPLLSSVLLGETTGTWYWAGLACIIVGILVVQLDI
jgi:drug/metabolite transporter (DMT)-like permease